MGFIYPPVLFNTAAGAVNNTIIDCFLMLLIRATAMDSILFYMKFSNDDGVKRKLKPDPFYGILLDKWLVILNQGYLYSREHLCSC